MNDEIPKNPLIRSLSRAHRFIAVVLAILLPIAFVIALFKR